MLTLDDCRRQLGRHGLTDEQLAEVRDTLNAFALVLVDEFAQGRLSSPPHPYDERPQSP